MASICATNSQIRCLVNHYIQMYLQDYKEKEKEKHYYVANGLVFVIFQSIHFQIKL